MNEQPNSDDLGEEEEIEWAEEDVPDFAKEPVNRRSSRAEYEARIERTAVLLGRRFYKSDIVNVLKRLYNVSARTCETYLSEAKKLLNERSGKTREEHFHDSEAFWESIVRDPVAQLREKMKAQEMLDWLHGLRPVEAAAPVSVNVVNVRARDLTDDQLAAIAARALPPGSSHAPDFIDGKLPAAPGAALQPDARASLGGNDDPPAGPREPA